MKTLVEAGLLLGAILTASFFAFIGAELVVPGTGWKAVGGVFALVSAGILGLISKNYF